MGEARKRDAGSARAIGAGLLLLTVIAASAVPSAPVSAEASPSGAAKRCKLPHAPGDVTVPLTSAGFDRPFLLHVPSGYNGRKPLPLVLNLHPSGSNGPQQMETSQMSAAADGQRMAVAAPNGGIVQGTGAHYWNVPGVPLTSGPVPPDAPDDERYLLDVMRAAARTVCIDPDRIYLTGFSGGGRMASQMACDYSKKIAAIAPVASLRAGVPQETSPDSWTPTPSTCSPKHPLSVQAFHGTEDGTNPFLGNDDPRWGYGVPAALDRWAELDGCKRHSSTQPTPSVTLISYSRCDSDTSVSLFQANGAGHTWPGSSGVGGGAVDQTIDATDLMLAFFKKHSLAERK